MEALLGRMALFLLFFASTVLVSGGLLLVLRLVQALGGVLAASSDLARASRNAGVAVGRAVRPRREPACGHCGYCVRGIASLSCPECGSDLREVGIIPGLRQE